MKTNTSSKANKSNKPNKVLAQKGSAAYMRELAVKGRTEAERFAAAVKRFPILQARKREFTPRWKAARKAVG